MTHQDFIKQVKDSIENQPIPPHYNPKEWKGKNFNCYLYALRACMDFETPLRFWIAPGFISRGENNDYRDTVACTLNYFKADCEELGLQVSPSTLEEKTGENEYKIAIYVNKGKDYHFVRQDCNGKWSEKRGWYKSIEIRKKEDVIKNKDGYIFIGIYKVSKKTG